MIDIANSFYKNGYDCSLIAGRIVERDIALNSEITVKKIIRYDRTSNIRRIFSWVIGTIQILGIILIRFRKSHLFIVSNPPFATLIPLFIRNNFSLMVFDIFPDALIEFGVFRKKSMIMRVWNWANRRVYKRATHIFTLTPGMKQAVAQYVDNEKIKVIPLWTSNNYLKPIPKKYNYFIDNHNLHGKFIVLYSGNFGIAYYLDLIIDIASKVTDKRIIFVIIGGGPAEKGLRQKIERLGLKNCLMLPWQEIQILPYSLSAADLSIVTLSENALKLGIPSKVYNYMSVGTPILCITGSGSDLDALIMDYNIGKSFTPQQIEEIVQYIYELLNNPKLQEYYHTNSLKASSFHTVKNVDLITNCYV